MLYDSLSMVLRYKYLVTFVGVPMSISPFFLFFFFFFFYEVRICGDILRIYCFVIFTIIFICILVHFTKHSHCKSNVIIFNDFVTIITVQLYSTYRYVKSKQLTHYAISRLVGENNLFNHTVTYTWNFCVTRLLLLSQE